MKISILISLLIIAAAAVLGWENHQQLTRIKVEHRKVVEEAAALGLAPEDGGDGGLARRPLRRDREDREAEAMEIAQEVIAFAKRMKEQQENGGQADEELQKETMQVMRRFLDLDAMQLKHLIGELKGSEEIDDDTRRGIVGFSIMMLANESPETALAIYAESSEMLGENGMGEHVISSSLSRLAEKDPFAALDWIRENGKKNPDLVTDRTKAAVIAGAARQDPAMAIQLMGELELKESHHASSGIALAADTPEKRLQLLETLRGLGGDSKDLQQSILRSMSGQVLKTGYEASLEWFEQADLSAGELDSFSSSLSYHSTQEDTGKWLEWIGENHSGDEISNKTGRLMRDWTRNDYEAAGNWLNEAKEGPAKSAAVVSYAKTVAPYEPESAAQWALTLPKGGERDDVLKNIHKEWKKKDEAAAAVFAAEHGIE